MMNQQNTATPVNYLNPELNPNNIRQFPPKAPSMAAPVPMPEPKYQNDKETNAIIAQTFANIGWAALVMVLALACNVITKELMGASLITNLCLTIGSWWKKDPKMTKFVTDINLGLVLLSAVTFIGQLVF